MSEEIQGWFDFQNIYDRMIAGCPPGGVIVELGVWKGKSLSYLAANAKKAGKGIRVVGIDNWLHNDWDGYWGIQRIDSEKGEKRSVRQQCEENLAFTGARDVVRLIESDSIAAAKLFADNSVDFIFIDDTHNVEHIKEEIAAWLPKLKRPTWIAGHDYPGNIAAGVLHHFPHATQDGASWVAEVK